MYKSIYKLMDEYLGGMDKGEARLELINHSLYRDHLSSYYYARLFDKYGRSEPEGVTMRDRNNGV